MPDLTAILSHATPASPRILLTENDQPGLSFFAPGASEPTVTWLPRAPGTVLEDALLLWLYFAEEQLDLAGFDAEAAEAARHGIWSPAELDDAKLERLLAQARQVESAAVAIQVWPGSVLDGQFGVLDGFSLEYDIFLRVAFRSSAASWETPGTREVTERRWSERGGSA